MAVGGGCSSPQQRFCSTGDDDKNKKKPAGFGQPNEEAKPGAGPGAKYQKPQEGQPPPPGDQDRVAGSRLHPGAKATSAPLQAPFFPYQKPFEIGKPEQTVDGFEAETSTDGMWQSRFSEANKRMGQPVNRKTEAYKEEQAEKKKIREDAERQEAKFEGRDADADKQEAFVDEEDPHMTAAAGGGKKGYTRSRDRFRHKTVFLDRSYAGSVDKRKIQWWETVWYNYIRYWGTYEYLVGKDRFGNRFLVAWYISRSRQEMRKCYRLDRNKAHQPYGCLPTDCRLWEEWLRGWRAAPPTPEEEEFYRRKKREKHGLHVVGNEEFEDTMVRAWAHSKTNSPVLQELDEDEQYNKFLISTHERERDADPTKENDETWTAAFVRGDMFYNEEEVEVMRSGLAHLYRDKEWQMLELKRQNRLKRQPYPVGKPSEQHMADPTEPSGREPPAHEWQRQDNHVPFGNGVSDLTTPELERLRFECDAIEEERIALRKELGLTDTGDLRDGREPIDKGYAPYQAPPTTDRWKPKCWREAWGIGGGRRDN